MSVSVSSPAGLLVLPVPRIVSLTDGTCLLGESPTVAFEAALEASPLDRATMRELSPARRAGGRADAHIVFHSARHAPADLRKFALQPEGYALAVENGGVRIWADHPAGRLYGAVTLGQLRRQFGGLLPCLRIGDAPKLAHRGVQLCYPQGQTAYRASYARRAVEQLVRWKINALYLYLETYFDFPSLPHLAGPGAMTADDARELDHLCREHNIQVIPQINVLGHCGEMLTLQKYHHLAEHSPNEDPRTLAGFNLCSSSPEVHRLVDTMLGDMFDAFGGDIIHVGGDEVSALGQCPMCQARTRGLSKPEIYLRYFGRVRDVARAAGRRIGLWGDMLLHDYRGASVRERRRAFQPLRDGVIIYDWHYESGSPGTLRFFTSEGFETVASASSNACYLSQPWLAVLPVQGRLFADAIGAGAWGGMITAWCNYAGIHEEMLNYVRAGGGTALWSGPAGPDLAQGLSNSRFERAYCLQRYGLPDTTLMRYWHVLGDVTGPVAGALGPLAGSGIRKCLYHTDNVLTMWQRYARLLRPERLVSYRSGVAQARRLWNQVRREARHCKDPYFPLHEAPLLTHEHLLRRFDMTEAVYRLYDQAAAAQFTDPRRCVRLMDRAAALLLGHLKDFPPVEKFLAAAHRQLGLDRGSIVRVQATKRKIRELAAFFKHLARGGRPLPAFGQLDSMFMRESRTAFAGDREHEWSGGPARFRRYTLDDGWADYGPQAIWECGPWVWVRQYQVSRFVPSTAEVWELTYPRSLAPLHLRPREFATPWGMIHHDLFNTAAPGYAYYVCRFRCDQPMKLRIELGYDGPVKMWVDRKPLFEDPNGINPAWPGMAKVPFHVRKGQHEILVALSSNCGKAYNIIMKLERLDCKPAGPDDDFAGRLPVILR